MNVSSGGLSFNFTANNDQLRRVIQQNKDDIKGLSDASKIGGAKMEAAFKQAYARIDEELNKADTVMSEHRAKIRALSEELKNLNTLKGQQFMAGDDAAYRATEQLIQAKKRELQATQDSMRTGEEYATQLGAHRQRIEEMEQATQQNATRQMSLRSELRMVREELARLESTEGVGVRQTEHFRELQQRAGELADALSDAQAQTAVFSDDNAMISGVIGGISGVAGAFSAVQGAMSLFGVENEKVQEAMLKVQSAMAITTGLQQVMTAVNKDSAFMLVIVQKAKDALTAANTRLSVALGISTVAAKALMATLTLGLSVAITALIFMWDKFSTKTQEAAKQTEATRKAFEEYHKTCASKSADLVGKYQQLADEYKKLKTEAEKTKWIKDNARAMDGLGLSVTGVTDADNIFVANSAKVVKALELRAEAMALQELQMKAYGEYYAKIRKADNTVAGGGYYEKYNGRGNGWTKGNPNMTDEMRAAGVTNADFTQRTTTTRTGGEVYDTIEYQESQRVIDKVNAYRSKKASETNATIRADATKALNDTLDYTRKRIELTEKEIASLNILKAGGESVAPTGTGGGKGKTAAEQYAEELNERKALYAKYNDFISSGEKELIDIAPQYFEGLLKDGSTYLDYLKKQQEALTGMTQTKEVTDKLRLVREQIAEATKGTVLKDFQEQLQADLKNCETLGAMLDVIEKRRKEVAQTQTGEVAQQENEMLDSAEADTRAQIEAKLGEMLITYADFADQRKAIERQFNQDMAVLQAARTKAATDAERDQIDRVIKARREKYDQDYRTAGNEIYTQMLTDYADYEEQRKAIVAKYDKQRETARQANNTKLLAKIDEAQRKELSALAKGVLTQDHLGKAFNDFGKMTLAEIDKLIEDINNRSLTVSADLTPEDLKELLEQLKKIRTEIASNNPFTALADALNQFKDDSSDANLNKVLDAGSSIAANFKDVSECMRKIAQYTNNDKLALAADAMDDIIGNIQAAEKGAEAWGGWWGAIIGGVLDAIPKVIKWASGDNTLQNKIDEYNQSLAKVKATMEQLNWEVGRALGEEVYSLQTKQLSNYREQSALVHQMLATEEQKKGKDVNKIQEYRNQIAELKRQEADVIAAISESITQTSAKGLAEELSSALITAFKGGEDAAKAFGQVTDDVIKKAVANALKMQLLEKPLQAAIAQLQRDMGFDEQGYGAFDGLSESEQKRFKDAVEAAGANFQKAMEVYQGLFAGLDSSDPSTLSGAIKGASQESIDLLAGQTNAVRQNQVVALGLVREQLIHLSNIDGNVSTIAGKLQTIINRLNTPQGNNLRAHGITD